MNSPAPSDRLYPTSLAEIDAWRIRHSTTLDEARKRFVQFTVLEAIARSEWREALAFKGGNALRFLHGNPRSTVDLDFTADTRFPQSEMEVRNALNASLQWIYQEFAVKAQTQRVKQNPGNPRATMPTMDISIGYSFPGDRTYAQFPPARPISTVIELEISVNDVVCETQDFKIDPQRSMRIRACTLEDILAEKLRALLQQKVRNRHRKQDVYDIARMIQENGGWLDRGKIATFFMSKCKARKIAARRRDFDEEIRRRAEYEYETLFSKTDPDFIPFEEAWARVRQLVNDLDIPD